MTIYKTCDNGWEFVFDGDKSKTCLFLRKNGCQDIKIDWSLDEIDQFIEFTNHG